MVPVPCTGVTRTLRRIALLHDGTSLSDAELLTLFIERHDEAAFEGLVRRHGPMVMGVCRRVLSNDADADDAFQATFLVLVKKAGTIVPRGMVGNWLHGVAHTTALKARLMNHTRRTREKHAATTRRQTGPPAAADDWAELLDDALGRLPDRYRAAVVLCELEGRSLKEAARLLDCPQGTVASRLARARRMLAGRLARAGLAVGAAALTAHLAEGAALGRVPMDLVACTSRAAARVAAGQAAGAVVHARVATLAEGVVKLMFIGKLKRILAALILTAFVAWALGQSAGSLVADQLGTDPAAARTAQPEAAGPAKKAPRAVTFPQLLQSLPWTVTHVDSTSALSTYRTPCCRPA
jgi:RNA polymerase sigma factor (sigma-70 family)